MSADGSGRMPQDDIDIDPPFRREIDMMYARLDDDDHYQILGLGRGADKKLVKSAFYGLAAKFHTDRHFGKRLGGYKAKMEAIFNRVNIAHETLSNTQRRAEYDDYVKELDRMRAFEDALQIDEGALVAIEEKATAPEAVRSISEPRMQAVVAPSARAPAPDAAEVDRMRREALARKLGGSNPRTRAAGASTQRMAAVTPSASSHPAIPATKPTRPPSIPPPPVTGMRPLDTMVAQARAAARAGDFSAASTQMRHAAKFDGTYAAEAEQLARQALVGMADTYVKQAREEEAQKQWLAAALSWSKAFEGRQDDAEIAERAANAMRRAGADLHKAVRLAEAAVRLRPDDPNTRFTLAEVYCDAGLQLRAKSELANAMKLSPRDPRVVDLASKLR